MHATIYSAFSQTEGGGELEGTVQVEAIGSDFLRMHVGLYDQEGDLTQYAQGIDLSASEARAIGRVLMAAADLMEGRHGT